MTDPPKIKTIEGQVSFIDQVAHKVTLKDKAGEQHTFVWPPTFNDAMAKLKPGFFTKLTGEHHTEFDLWKLTGQGYFKRPDDWPAPQKLGGGFNPGGFQKKPRVTIGCKIFLQNYETVSVEVEGSSADECNKIMIDTLNGFATNPAYSTTRDMIQNYMARVLNVKGAEKK